MCNNIKITHKISNTIQKILAYKSWAKFINLTEVVFTSSNVKTVGRNTMDKLADHSAGGKMNIFSLSNTEI